MHQEREGRDEMSQGRSVAPNIPNANSSLLDVGWIDRDCFL